MENPGSTQTGEADIIVCETELAQFRRSRIHGMGGYARRAIGKGTRIIEYVGKRISKAESNTQCEGDNVYIFTLDDEFDLDGNVEWNPARFINHSCAPNCEAEWDEDRLWIVALRDIESEEELSFNYGYDLEDYREHPCLCGTSECVGYIVAEEHFGHVRTQAALGKLAMG